ncbi:NADH-quinone oxidoreductase subunit NuoE [Pseudomonas sp. QL9]|nr:NADH-quinone oxidoreductase subunit NuoE [Pseudomonas knackmussii]
MIMSTLIQTDRFALSETERSAIEHEMHHYEDSRAASIEALKIVQKQRGWVPDGAIPAIAEILGIPDSDVEGVATFYSQIFRQPVGRHIIRVCDSMVCYIGGHESVVGEIQKQLGIGLGQTTADGRFTLLPVCCLGNCDKAPALMIDDDTHGDVVPAGVAKLLEAYA